MDSSSIPQDSTEKIITFVLDGIPFTGKLLKVYPTAHGHMMMAVQVNGWSINGKWYAAESDDSAVQVSVEALV